MNLAADLSADQGTLAIFVPLTMRRHGGRKQVVVPAGATDWAPSTWNHSWLTRLFLKRL